VDHHRSDPPVHLRHLLRGLSPLWDPFDEAEGQRRLWARCLSHGCGDEGWVINGLSQWIGIIRREYGMWRVWQDVRAYISFARKGLYLSDGVWSLHFRYIIRERDKPHRSLNSRPPIVPYQLQKPCRLHSIPMLPLIHRLAAPPQPPMFQPPP